MLFGHERLSRGTYSCILTRHSHHGKFAVAETKAREKPLILVVDDDNLHRKAARDVLANAEFMTEEAVDGEEALMAIERHRPDLVLLDLMMPKLNGFGVCAKLRRNPLFKHLPVLVISAYDTQQTIDRAYDVGANDFIAKPVSWMMLVDNIRHALRTSQREGALRAKAASPA
jgi:PleD family two-component response regulator